MEKDIDFVMLWVDGSDSAWQAEKAKYSEDENGDQKNIRYRDWNNLQYWFRGVEKYAPWVRKIHLVTCGQIPSFLNINHPKINVVFHEDIIKKEYLPTFSSIAIEANIHRIKDLSEQFVYFNDDIFITNKLSKTDFFRNGLPCTNVTYEPIMPYESLDMTYIGNVLSDLKIINKHYSGNRLDKKIEFSREYSIRNIVKNILLHPWVQYNFIGFHENHLTNSYLRSVFEECWNVEPDILEQATSHKFRTSTDINQYLFKYWQICQGKIAPVNDYYLGRYFEISKDNSAIKQAIEEQKYKLICINDKEIDDFEKEKNEINNCLKKIFQDKSAFEK